MATAIPGPNGQGHSNGKGLKMAVLCAIILGGSFYLCFIAWTRITPNGAANYLAEIERDKAKSRDEVEKERIRLKMAEIELQLAKEGK